MTGGPSPRSPELVLSRLRRSRAGRALEGRAGTALCLALMVLLVSYPLLTTVAWYQDGQDLVFHLSRIEGIKEGLLSGQFPVKIEPPQLNGAGYANGVFYPDLFLYVPALLSLAGLDVVVAWNAFLVLENAACCLIAYWCFRRIFSSRPIGLVATFLYAAGFYRLMDIYARSALGEHVALTFFPLVAYGLWTLYSTSGTQEQRGRAWVPLTVAFFCIMQSHLLSVEIAGLFAVIVALVRWRQTLTRQVLACWLKVALLVVLLDLFFLVPLVDYMQGDFYITDPSRKTWAIQSCGMNPLELLILFPDDSFRSVVSVFGISVGMPLGIGAGLLLGTIASIGLLASKSGPRVSRAYRLALGLGLLALWMSTCAFPWDALELALGPLGTLVSNLQFPWRLLGMTALFLVIASCGALKALSDAGRGRAAVALATAMVALTAVTAVTFINQQVSEASAFTDDDLAYYLGSSDYGSVGNGEYLSSEVVDQLDQDVLVTIQPSSSDNVRLSGYLKSYLDVRLSVTETSGDQDGYVDVPLLYYKGYAAVDADTGETLDVEPADDDESVVRVVIPAGYDGTVDVSFVEPWYWRAAEVVSLATAVALAVGLLVRRTAGRGRPGMAP